MADADPKAQVGGEECREPTLEDLVHLCRALNDFKAKYIVVGGFAIRAAGYTRNTMDIDLLVETGLENEKRVLEALMMLPDKAARELQPGEIDQHGVVRVADEILVDLMKSGCGVNYAVAISDAVYHEINGVRIPFASAQTLWKMKQTVREKDIPDRLFLSQLLGLSADASAKAQPPPQQPWWRRFFNRPK